MILRTTSHRVTAWLFAIGVLVLSPCASAQTTGPTPPANEASAQTVVNVASRLPQGLDRLSAVAVVITREALAALPALRVGVDVVMVAGVLYTYGSAGE